MTDVSFIVQHDQLLAKRPTAIREAQVQRLEFRALYEECLEAECDLVAEAAFAVRKMIGANRRRSLNG